MAHYDCTRCGHSFGIGPGYCEKCSTPEEIKEIELSELKFEVHNAQLRLQQAQRKLDAVKRGNK